MYIVFAGDDPAYISYGGYGFIHSVAEVDEAMAIVDTLMDIRPEFRESTSGDDVVAWAHILDTETGVVLYEQSN